MLGQFVTDKWYGGVAVWLAWGLLVLGYCMVFGPYRCVCYLTTVLVISHLLGVPVLLGLFVRSLVLRRWGHSIGQLLFGVCSVAAYCAALVAVSLMVTFSERNLKDFNPENEAWYGTKACEEIPFAVEFRSGHAFLAEYDRRVVFKSGKSVVLNFDTGGAGDFAVYALKDGCYCLIDGLKMIQHRNEYRINLNTETVERNNDGEWMEVSEEPMRKMNGSGVSCPERSPKRGRRFGEPLGDSLDEKRYLGRITTRGKLELGGAEPIAEQDEVSWKSSEITDKIPFGYELGESKTKCTFSRIAFKSGKKVVFLDGWSLEPHDVYRMKDGRFVFASREGTMWEYGSVIDTTREVVSHHQKGFLIRIPDDAEKICGSSAGKGIASLEVKTKNGRVIVRGEERIESLYLDSEYVGRIEPDGKVISHTDEAFRTTLERALLASSQWDEGEAVKSLTAAFDKLVKGDRQLLKEKIKRLPGWRITYAGKRGDDASKVFHAGMQSCYVALGLDGDKVLCTVTAAGRSNTPKAAQYAAAVAAAEELSSLKGL